MAEVHILYNKSIIQMIEESRTMKPPLKKQCTTSNPNASFVIFSKIDISNSSTFQLASPLSQGEVRTKSGSLRSSHRRVYECDDTDSSASGDASSIGGQGQVVL